MNLLQIILFLSIFSILFFSVSLFIYCKINYKIDKNKYYLTDLFFLKAFLIFLIISFILLISIRNPSFGTDSQVYISLFNDYCLGSIDYHNDLEFYLTFMFINSVMLMNCDASLLPLVWVLIVAALVILASFNNARFGYASLLLISIVGLEFTTNALRQGFSIGFLILGISIFYNKNPFRHIVGVLLMGLALFLHSSSALVVASILLALLHWRVFFFILAIFLYLVISGWMRFFEMIPGVGIFLNEIEKFSNVPHDEIWIRLLIFVSLVMLLLIPILSRNKYIKIREIINESAYAFSLRLFIITLPALTVPYFGYRFGYSVYAVILFWLMNSIDYRKISNIRFFIILFISNLIILFVWSNSTLLKLTNIV